MLAIEQIKQYYIIFTSLVCINQGIKKPSTGVTNMPQKIHEMNQIRKKIKKD